MDGSTAGTSQVAHAIMALFILKTGNDIMKNGNHLMKTCCVRSLFWLLVLRCLASHTRGKGAQTAILARKASLSGLPTAANGLSIG
jgi:hypothetical protein